MKTALRILLGFFVTALAASGQSAPTVVATPAVGYARFTARGASDSLLAVPFVRRSALLSRVAGVDHGSVTLAATDAVDGAYAPGAGSVYYLQFVSGNLAGFCYKVLNNQGGVFTLATLGDDLTGHPMGPVVVGASGDFVRVRPFWTIGTIFGNDPAGIPLAPLAAFNGPIYPGADQILLPDNVSLGSHKAPAKVIAYVTGSGWRERTDAAGDASSTELWPGVPFTFRRSGVASTDVVVVGYVAADRLVQSVPALPAGADMDMAVSLAFPAPLALANSGLFSAGSPVIGASSDASHAGDAVLADSGARQGFALPAEHRFIVTGAGWLEAGAPADQFTLQPENGYVLRFRGGHPVRYWIQTPPVSPP